MGKVAKLHLQLLITPGLWHYCLNPICPPPCLSVERLSSTKLSPGAKKVEDHCFNYIVDTGRPNSLSVDLMVETYNVAKLTHLNRLFPF